MNKLDFENKDSVPPPKVESKRELAQALPTDVLVDTDERGKVFCYIDDLIAVSLFSLAWHRLAYLVVVIIDVFARSVHSYEPVYRDHLLSMKKLFTKESLEE